jgi:hypothetical protein
MQRWGSVRSCKPKKFLHWLICATVHRLTYRVRVPRYFRSG